jgi:hypothetical protein
MRCVPLIPWRRISRRLRRSGRKFGRLFHAASFLGRAPEGSEHRGLCLAFDGLIQGLPAIDGWRLTARPEDLDSIAQWRHDAKELGDPEAVITVERMIDAPGRDIEAYRSRFHTKRRQLVRKRLDELVTDADALLSSLLKDHPARDFEKSIRSPRWTDLGVYVGEIDRLLGTAPRSSGWLTMERHLKFAQACDLHDIVETDWPAVKADIGRLAYDESEPLPIDVPDLGELVRAQPSGAVRTDLNWAALNDRGFEALIFDLMSDTLGYENAQWLTHENAPDRARDVSVTRVREDALCYVRRERVIIQCKHWQRKSVSVGDISAALAKLELWEPPPVDMFVIATSGRFTSDAVAWVEKRNGKGERPWIEPWPESRLEQLLARRPDLVASHNLR